MAMMRVSHYLLQPDDAKSSECEDFKVGLPWLLMIMMLIIILLILIYINTGIVAGVWSWSTSVDGDNVWRLDIDGNECLILIVGYWLLMMNDGWWVRILMSVGD
jgi:hypothetical protein